MFFAKSTGGFYAEDIHGARTLQVQDPAWVRPLIDVTLQPGEQYFVDGQQVTNTGAEPQTLQGVADMSAVAPTIEVENPECLIPADAVQITAEEHAALLSGQALGKRIEPDADGRPVLHAPPQPTAAEIKVAAWERIKDERDRRTQHGGYKVGTVWFHSDTFSRTQQMGLVMYGANMPAGIKWKTMSGAFVDMTPALAQQVFAAAGASDVAIFQAAEVHRAAMEASADPAAYDFSGGWPVAFGE